MKINLKCKILLPLLLMASNSFANDDFMQMQKFYYEQGYKEAAKKFYYKGIEDYQNHVLENVLPQYEARFMAIEATKYLLKENYITYPESYRENNNGSYKVVITEPKIEKPIRAEELFRMPELKESKQREGDERESALKTTNKDETFNNGLKIVNDSDTKEDIPNSVSAIRKQVSLDVSKTKENLSMIQKLELKYLDSFSGYKIYFENNTQKADFCFQLTGDASCSNIN